jgi:26S proteasome regulatory subunit N5
MECCYEARAYDLLNSTITLLSKKHGQLKGAVQEMVELAMEWLDEIQKNAGTDRWLQVVETLRGVTEGKVRPHNLARKNEN